MPVNLSVKNVPDEVMEKLRERAKRHHRSLRGEVLAILEAATGAEGLSWGAAPSREIHSLEEAERRLSALNFATGDESTAWLREMRDGRQSS